MMKKYWNEHGFTTTFIAIMLPIIIAILGLCVDGTVVIYQRIALETATDAASRSAIDAYDRDTWINERRVVLEQSRAEEIAKEILNKNIANAHVENVEIPVDNPSVCRITTSLSVPLFFMQLFGVDYYVLEAHSQAFGYAEEDS